MTGLVREAGGLGDIICLGAAARAIKVESNYTERVLAFVPEELVTVAEHLAGIDEVISLGKLSVIQAQRRNRDGALDVNNHPYLQVIQRFPEIKVVDEYCPSFLYENSCPDQLKFNRPQLFAMAAGVQRVKEAIPVWTVKQSETEATCGLLPAGRLIAFQYRGTCRARCLPPKLLLDLLQSLSQDANVLLFDCVQPTIKVPDNVYKFIGLPVPLVAAMVSQCDFAVTIDSFLWHLAAALSVPAVGIFGVTDGVVASQTYPFGLAVNGIGQNCIIPCNYNSTKGWTQRCRETLCERMLSVSLEDVLEAVSELSKKACRNPSLEL